MVKILIVAAYASVRAGLHALLAETPNFAVVGEVSGSAELEGVLTQSAPDVVLCDAQGGEMLRVAEKLVGREIGLVALGDERDDTRRLMGLDLSGWAYLQRDAGRDEIVAAALAAAAGLVTFDRSLLPTLRLNAPALPTGGTSEDTFPGETLTSREHEVLQLLAQGLLNKQIAARLGISQHTVKFHVASILAKLGAMSRTEAVTMGARRGLILL